MRFHSLLAAGFAAATLLVVSPAAQAIPLVRSTSFSITNGLVPVMGVPTFDPTLGTLDRVSIHISAAFSFQVQIAPGGSVTPLLTLSLSRLGLSGFDFQSGPFTYATQVNADPNAPVSALYASNVNFFATFDAFSDLVGGFTLPSLSITGASGGPLLATADRADFVDNIANLPVSEVMVLAPGNFTPSVPITGAGGMIVTYEYTPAPEPVSEPLALLGLGLAGLGAVVVHRR